jgi:hypothetical protein
MIQLLIALAIVALLAYTLLGGEDKHENTGAEPPARIYQQHVEQARGIEESLQRSAEQRMRDYDRHIGGE